MRIGPSQIGDAAELFKRAAPKLGELKKATQDFEAVFLKKLFSTMREGVKHVKLGDSEGQDMYNDMFDQALAEGASKSGSYGIGKTLYRSFAPKVVAMEQLRIRAEHAASFRRAHAPAPGPNEDRPLQHTPISDKTR